MNLQEHIRKALREVRVPRNERVELYKDDNIIVIVPLTHRALKKYAHQCQWCINDDESEWEDYHKGKHAVIIQRNPKKPKKGITNHPVPTEIFFIAKWDNNQSSFEDICQILDYEFRSDRSMGNYYNEISNDINNFATNIVYYSPETGIYDQEDNFLWNFNFEISDIPNVTPEVIKIMDDYLQESEEMNLQEHIRRILREETELPIYFRRRVKADDLEREFSESLDMSSNMLRNTNKEYESIMSLNRFIDVTISILMDGIHYELHSTMPEDSQWYGEVKESLKDHYKNRIKHRYEKLISNI